MSETNYRFFFYPGGTTMEKRTSGRIPKNLQVAFPCCRKLYAGTVTDLSESGMLINSDINLPIKSKFDILMSIKKEILKIPAIFVRLEKEGSTYKGMGSKGMGSNLQ